MAFHKHKSLLEGWTSPHPLSIFCFELLSRDRECVACLGQVGWQAPRSEDNQLSLGPFSIFNVSYLIFLLTLVLGNLLCLFSMDRPLGFLLTFILPKIPSGLDLELGCFLASFFVFFRLLALAPFTKKPCPHLQPQRLRRLSLLIFLFALWSKFLSRTLPGVNLVALLLKMETQLLGNLKKG